MKWKWLLLFAIVVSGCYVNLIYYKPVTPLPNDAELLQHINRYDEDYQVQTIVNRIQLDKHHYVVPIKFKEHQNGLSFWKWHKGQWRLVQFTTTDLLRWQLNEHDPATNYFVWHLADWEMATVDFHLVRERYFSIHHENEHQYDPRIQLSQSIVLKESGALPLPDAWKDVIANVHLPAVQSDGSFFSEGVPEEFTFAATYDDVFLEESGYTYLTDEAQSTISYFMYMDERELE